MQNVESAAVNTVIIKLIRFLADSFFMSNKIKKINKYVENKASEARQEEQMSLYSDILEIIHILSKNRKCPDLL